MDEYLELPTMEARQWLAGGARACGYAENDADLLAYLAWWLENRGMQGVQRTAVYLLMVHGRPHDHLKPRREGERAVCLCPIEAGMMLAYPFLSRTDDLREWSRGVATADPLLVGVVLLRILEYKYNVHLRYNDQHLILAEKGIALLSDSLAGFAMCDYRSGTDMALRLVGAGDEEVPFTTLYEKRESLRVPRVRYLPGGGFSFA